MIKKMEKAIFTNEPEKYDLTKYKRIYFGNEFCENNFISLARVKEIVTLAQREGKGITFVTPFVTDKGLKIMERYLHEIPKGSEVVFNDYGMLPLLTSFPPALGGLLTRQKRGRGSFNLRGKYPEKAMII